MFPACFIIPLTNSTAYATIFVWETLGIKLSAKPAAELFNYIE